MNASYFDSNVDFSLELSIAKRFLYSPTIFADEGF